MAYVLLALIAFAVVVAVALLWVALRRPGSSAVSNVTAAEPFVDSDDNDEPRPPEGHDPGDNVGELAPDLGYGPSDSGEDTTRGTPDLAPASELVRVSSLQPAGSVARRTRSPLAPTLRERLSVTNGTPHADELVAQFDRLAPFAASEHATAALASLGYEVRWRSGEALALASPGGRVALLTVSGPDAGAQLTIELDPAETTQVAARLVERLQAAGYGANQRRPGEIRLVGAEGAVVRLHRRTRIGHIS